MVMALGLTKAFLPIMASNLDPAGVLVGLATSSWFLFRVFLEIPSGFILVRVGRRRLLVLGLSLGVLSPIICAYANNIFLLILGMALWGVGAALFFICSTVTLFDLFELDRRGKAVGAFQGLELIGNFIGAPIGAVVAVSTGYSNVFIIASLMIFAGSLITLGCEEVTKLDLKSNSKSELRPFRSAIAGMKNRGLIAVSFVNMSKNLVTQGIIFTVFQLYLNSQLNMSLEIIGLILAARMGSYICATLVSGHAAEKLGRKRLIAANLLIEAVCLSLYTITYNFGQVLILTIIEGAASGFVFANLIVLMSEFVEPSTRGIAVGVYRTFMDIGGILGPIIFMLLYTYFSAAAAFLSAGFVFLLSIGALFFAKYNAKVA